MKCSGLSILQVVAFLPSPSYKKNIIFLPTRLLFSIYLNAVRPRLTQTAAAVLKKQIRISR